MPAWKKLGLLPASAAGVAAAVVLTALLCLTLTPVFTREYLPLDRVGAVAVLAAGASVLIAVRMTAALRPRQTLATAGCVAVGYLLLAALVCALGGPRFAFGPWLLRLGGAAVAGSLLGAIMSLRARPRNRRTRGK